MYLSNKVTCPVYHLRSPALLAQTKAPRCCCAADSVTPPQQADLTNTVKHCSASLPNFAKPHNSRYRFKDSICYISNNPFYLSSSFQIFFIVLYNCLHLPYSGLLSRLFSSSYKNIIINLDLKKQNSDTTVSARGMLVGGFNPSAWSDGHCPHIINITCRGVTGTARMLHALTHSSISRQVREQM